MNTPSYNKLSSSFEAHLDMFFLQDGYIANRLNNSPPDNKGGDKKRSREDENKKSQAEKRRKVN